MTERTLVAEPVISASRSSGTVTGSWRFILRVFAFWFGLFTLVNVVVSVRHPSFDANLWWIDLRFAPRSMGQVLLLIAGLLLIAHAIRPALRGWRRSIGTASIIVLVVSAISDSVSFYRAWASGSVAPKVPVPLSVFIALALALIGWSILRPAAGLERWPSRVALVAVATFAFIAGFPLAQIVFFGTTDYRRPADVIVVFGAKVENSGQASIALADRVRTGAELYREGLADTVIMSGGVEPNGSDETAVMRDLAEREGVPVDAILLDSDGVNTDASVRDTTEIFREQGFKRILAVSHFYHLARIKLAYARAGYDVWTVPSYDTPIRQNPLIIAREIAAFWVYYLRATLS
jgi:uncharacterized SAM-binding protein YcdF (DUF218 family)